MGKLKVGIIGVGGIAGTHVPGWEASAEAELVAGCDIDEDRGCRVCQCCPFMRRSKRSCGGSTQLCEELDQRRKDGHRAEPPLPNRKDRR